MIRPNEEVRRLWALPSDQFNEWRRQNDLPLLLQYFKKALPHFDEWLSMYSIDDNRFLSATRPSRFFRGVTPQHLRATVGPDERDAENVVLRFFDRPYDSDADRSSQEKHFGRIRYRLVWETRFLPFFRWLATVKGMKAFRVQGDFEANAFHTDFSFRLKEAPDTLSSRAFLFHSHQVLKLGGVTINAMAFDDRNLDFVDLDHLEVVGQGASRETNVAYSSCYQMVFSAYEKPFVVFDRSPLDAPRFERCHLEKFVFIESSLGRPIFRDVRLSRCELRESAMSQVNFERCDLVDLKVVPPRHFWGNGLADFYKRLRVAYQAQGDRDGASRFYYAERIQRMRSRAFPIVPRDAAGMPRLAYSGDFRSLYEYWERGQMNTGKVLSLLRLNAVAVFKIFAYPPYLGRFLRMKMRLLPEMFDWAVWGFGEKPSRVFVWMVALLGLFTARYYFGATKALAGDFFASLSCSTYNFATIGCEYRGRFDSAEGILGAILIGVMVAGFANRTRY